MKRLAAALCAALALALPSPSRAALVWLTSPDGSFEYTQDWIDITDYVAFLNADKTPRGPAFDYCHIYWLNSSGPQSITRSGGQGSYVYATAATGPVYYYIGMYAMMGFANYLATGSSSSAVSPAAYDFVNAQGPSNCNNGPNPQRNPNADYWIISVGEYENAITTAQTNAERTDTYDSFLLNGYFAIKRLVDLSVETQYVAKTFGWTSAADDPPIYWRLARKRGLTQCN